MFSNSLLYCTGSYDSSLFSLKSSLLKATVDTLMRVTHLPRIRIQKEAFHIEPSNAYFVGALMDVPPPICKYSLTFCLL